MKIRFSSLLIFILLLPECILPNNGAAYIENALVIDSVFSWEVYYERTDEWTPGIISNTFGSSAISFNFNTSALASPSILIEPLCPLADSIFAILVKIVGGKCIIDISSLLPPSKVTLDTLINIFPKNIKVKLFTISMIITDPSQTSELSWDTWNTGFFDNADQTIYTILTGSANAPLPVELKSFLAKVKDSDVILEWTTETEVNNYGFEIERLNNPNPQSPIRNSQWKMIGFVEGAGNSNSPKDYKFIDEEPTGGSIFSYRLKQIDNDGNYTYSNEITVEIIPLAYELFQNYPNPFNPETIIKFTLLKAGLITLKVYDVLGQEITTLINEILPAGRHKYRFSATGFASGVYLYRLETAEYAGVKKMMLIK